VTSAATTTLRGRCAFGAATRESRRALTHPTLRPRSAATCASVCLRHTWSRQIASSILPARRADCDCFPHRGQRYRRTPFRRPFLDIGPPQDGHFFCGHIGWTLQLFADNTQKTAVFGRLL